MELIGVRVEVPTNQPIVLLREADGERALPIFIGNPEATAIVHAMQGLSTPRPMTHDLLATVLAHSGTALRSVTITEVHDRTFHAELELERDGVTERLDVRPSDAIALLVRVGPDTIPIWAADEVLETSGVLVGESDEDAEGTADDEIERFRSFLDEISPEDFV